METHLKKNGTYGNNLKERSRQDGVRVRREKRLQGRGQASKTSMKVDAGAQ